MSLDFSKILLITDLDGTLLPHTKILSEADVNAIKHFVELGGNFSIATGRSIQSVKQYFDSLEINVPAILYNGAMIYDTNQNRIISSKLLAPSSRDIVENVLREFPDASAEILTFEKLFALQLNEFEKHHIEVTKTEVTECELCDIPGDWIKVLFAISPERMNELKDYINMCNFQNVEFVLSYRYFYEMLPQAVSKGTALENLKQLYELNDYLVVAVGDFDNDIEMLKIADVGVATANALDEVKATADIVLDETCNDNAITKVIDYIISNEILNKRRLKNGRN